MVIKCKLCGVQYRKEADVSFHVFPKDPVLRRKWVEACKLHKFATCHPNELLDLRICSKHFDADSYVPYNTTGIPYLKRDAVPRLVKLRKKRNNSTIVNAKPINVSGQNTEVISKQLSPSVNNQPNHDSSVIEYLNITDQIFTNIERGKLELCKKNTKYIPIIMNEVVTNKVVISQKKNKLNLLDENAKQFTLSMVMNEEISKERDRLNLCDENAESIAMNEVVMSQKENKLNACNENAEQFTLPMVMDEVISEEKDQLSFCNENAESIVMNEMFTTEEKDKIDFYDENIEQCVPIVMSEIVISEEKDELDLCDKNAEQPPTVNDVVISEERDNLDLHDENIEYITEEMTDDADIAEDTAVIKKRKIWRPANVVQLTEEHFGTPKDRELHLSLVKRKFEEQKKMIKSLQRQKRQLHKKIAMFSDVLHKLKNKELIKEDVANTLFMYYNTIFQIKSSRAHL